MVNYRATDQWPVAYNVSDELTSLPVRTQTIQVGLLDKDYVWYTVDWLITFYVTVTVKHFLLRYFGSWDICQLQKYSKLRIMLWDS